MTKSRSDMPRLHGKKRLYQILLDPEKAKEVDNQAANEQVRATALIRQWILDRLKSCT